MENNNQMLAVITESALEKETADNLLAKFQPLFDKATEWKKKAEALVVTDESQIHEMRMAGEARKAIKAIRIDADKTRKALKEDSLRYGRAVQGVYAVIEYLVVPIEEHLEKQEKFREIRQAERKEALRATRLEQLQPYSEFVPFGLDLGFMAEEDFEKTLIGAKLQMEAKAEEARKKEQERIEKEKAEAEERERVRVENERLRKEAEQKERLEALKKELRDARAKELQPYIVFIRDYNALIDKTEDEYQAELKDIKTGAELQWADDRKRADEKRIADEQAEKERAELEKQLQEKQKAEEARKKAEEKEAKAKERAAKKAKAAPDREKLLLLVKQLGNIELPVMKTEEGNVVLAFAEGGLSELIKSINKQIEERL